MKDAHERELHWYEESGGGGVVKEITENTTNIHHNKCEIITTTTMVVEEQYPLSQQQQQQQQEHNPKEDFSPLISPTKLLEPYDAEPQQLCKEENGIAKEEEEEEELSNEGDDHNDGHHDNGEDLELHVGECGHHDMADSTVPDTPIQDSDYNNKSMTDEQCVHSDAVKTGKTVKVNRVTPFRYSDQEHGNLLIDLTENQVPDESTYTKVKNKAEEKTFCATFVEEVGISQERFTTDLPRHNWLVKRLKQQNQLNDGDDCNTTEVLYKSSVKEGKEGGGENNNHPSSGPSSSEFKPIEVAQLPSLVPDQSANTGKEYDVLTVVPTSLFCGSETSTKTSDTTTPVTPTSPRIKDDVCTTTTTTPTSSSPSKESSPPKSPSNKQESVSPRSPTTAAFMPMSPSQKLNGTEPDAKPNSVTTSPVQKAPVMDGRKCPPPLSGIAMSGTLKYDSLSRFNPGPPKHHLPPSGSYPQVCESYGVHQQPTNHITDVRMRDVGRPLPLHMQVCNHHLSYLAYREKEAKNIQFSSNILIFLFDRKIYLEYQEYIICPFINTEKMHIHQKDRNNQILDWK